MTDSPRLSIVLPCYNEASSLERILQRFEEAGSEHDFELILVDNGSTDATATRLAELLPRYAFARSVTVDVNQGYGHGIMQGLLATRGEVVAWSHADMQTDPADVFRGLSRYEQAHDPERTLVKGRRRGRRFSEKLITWGMQIVATCLLRTHLHEINAQPKVFHRRLLDKLDDPPRDFNFDVYVLYRAKRSGYRIVSVPVQFAPREHGQSHWAATWRSRLRTMARSFRYLVGLAFRGQSSQRL